MSLSTARWEAIRAEFSIGSSVRGLARRYGVDESTIREKSRNQRWVYDPQAAMRVQDVADRRIAESLVARRGSGLPGAPGPAPSGSAGLEHEAGPASMAELLDRFRIELVQAAVDAKTELIAHATLAALEQAEALQTVFDLYIQLLTDALRRPAPGDVAGAARQAEAMSLLLAASGDRLSRHATAVGDLADRIQRQVRKALDMDKPPRQAPPALAAVPVPPKPASTIDFSRWKLEDALKVLEAIRILDGYQERPPIPVPPGDPPEWCLPPLSRSSEPSRAAGAGIPEGW